ncbi:MAG: FHA domain-containing protein [Lewinellaceae bacterium]|nr:FHA domain-containing protein [Lewinellaceae bacterium]
MAQMIWRKNIVALFLAAGLALSCPSPAGAQQNGDQKLIWASRSDANAPGIEAAGVDTASNVDAVYHDKETKTIDLFFRAWDGNRQFWDFDEKNLVVKEVVGEDTLDLPVVFQGRVSDTTLFGAGEVFQVKTQSERDYHREKRTYLLTWRSPDPNQKEMLADISVQKNWSLLTPFSLTRQLSFWDLLVLALFILAAALLVLSELFPWINIYQFKKKYVVPYAQVKKEGERKLNPITGRALEPNEMVVHLCDRAMCDVPFRIWKNRNYRCWHCPEHCDGDAHVWTGEFFSQKGGAQKLNWLWFGAAGGALAWLINVGLERALAGSAAENQEYEYALLGFSMGLAYAFMLSWVEEIGQGRSLSVGRILLRTLMGATMGALLFYVSSLIGDANWLGAITWLVFCVLLGLVISFNSSINWKRGALSGLIAGLVSGVVYYLIPLLFPEASVVKIITLIVAGGILGQGMIQVVKRLDKIELQVVSPSYRSGIVFALDNFLLAGKNILIGKDMKTCDVRVKWEDPYVLAKHAELRLANNQVYIKPLGEAELWINEDRLQNGKSMLIKGGEIIRLGRNSDTVFKYLQKS